MQSFFDKLDTELKIRGFTAQTRKNYKQQLKSFLSYCKKDPKKATSDDIKAYLAYLIADKQLKATSVNLALSSLKFFFLEVLEKDIFKKIKAPKIAKKLPAVLTKEEVKRIIESAHSLKNKLLIELMYSSGLRVSEVVKIRLEDIDADDKMGIVRAAKGQKDRNIILSDQFVMDFLDYKDIKELGDAGYLFASRGKCLTTRQAQNIVKETAKKAGIKKNVYCHVLRSSFATHLLEAGVDIRVIQELLGHANLQTTQIYTKVSKEQLRKVISPLDS